jgi:hypothetical protein
VEVEVEEVPHPCPQAHRLRGFDQSHVTSHPTRINLGG